MHPNRMRSLHLLVLGIVLLSWRPFASFPLRLATTLWSPEHTWAILACVALCIPIRLAVAQWVMPLPPAIRSSVEMERLLSTGGSAAILTLQTRGAQTRALGMAPVRVSCTFLLKDAFYAFGILAVRSVGSRLLAIEVLAWRAGAIRRGIVVCAGDVGWGVLREIRRSALQIEPVGFVDTDPRKLGPTLVRIQALGNIAELGKLVRDSEVIIVVAGVRGTTVRGVMRVVANTKTPAPTRDRVQVLPRSTCRNDSELS